MKSRAVGLESIVRIYALKIRPRAQAELAWYVPGIGELYVYDTALRLVPSSVCSQRRFIFTPARA
jgi:hypothetical protein